MANQFDAKKHIMSILAQQYPEMLDQDEVNESLATGKCSPSCPRNVETGECAYCTDMEQMLTDGIKLEYTDGTSEILKRK